MTCVSCSRANPDTANFCAYCGQPMQRTEGWPPVGGGSVPHPEIGAELRGLRRLKVVVWLECFDDEIKKLLGQVNNRLICGIVEEELRQGDLIPIADLDYRDYDSGNVPLLCVTVTARRAVVDSLRIPEALKRADIEELRAAIKADVTTYVLCEITLHLQQRAILLRNNALCHDRLLYGHYVSIVEERDLAERIVGHVSRLAKEFLKSHGRANRTGPE